MVKYRRNFQIGGTYFFTVTLKERRSRLLIEKIHLLKEAVQKVKKLHPFQIKGWVVLPEHLHMIWELPAWDADYSTRWKKIKIAFSKSIVKSGIFLSKTKHNEYNLWQRRFWEHTINDWDDYENHLNYIHYNAVKHGLAESPKDWPHSSFLYYVQKGWLDKNWGVGDMSKKNFHFGE